MKKISTAQSIHTLIKKSKNILILSHHNPDGDAVGSSLSLYFLLKKLNRKVNIILPNTFPEFLTWMPHSQSILLFDKQKEKTTQLISKTDLIFLLDCNSFKRLGTDGLAELATQSNAKKILIDHHKMPEKYFDAYFFDDTASSTCELIYKLSEHLKISDLVDKKSAQCIYTGIMTDTGSFKFDSVSPYTMKVVAKLLEYKIHHSDIQRNVFDTYSYDRLKLIGYALAQKLKYLPEKNTAYIVLTQNELKNFNHKKGDTEGLVNMPLSIKNVNISALFTETDQFIKVSLRSKGNIDVNEIARKFFNGGGHKNAAGGQLNMSINDIENYFETILQKLNTANK